MTTKKPDTTQSASDRDLKRLEHLLTAKHPCVAITTVEEDHALELLTYAVARTGHPMWIWSATRGVYAGLFENARSIPQTEKAAVGLHYFLTEVKEKAVCVALDLCDHLSDPGTLRGVREVLRHFRSTGSTLVLIDHNDNLPAVLKNEATMMELALPDETELERIVRRTVQMHNQQMAIEVKLTKRDFRTILRNLAGLTRRQAEQIITDAVLEDRRFTTDDINRILASKRQRLQHGGILDYVEAPTSLDSIGGLSNLKKWLKQRQNALSEDAFQYGLTPPRGVLLLGVQGAGKSLSAKAIATAWQRPLLRLDPGALFDKYIGESERKLRDALHQAEMMSPIILWIDEIEKGFASAATHSNDGGLSQRMFGTLLTWMQEHTAPVFLVATANNIDALPPELLRKGRFDEIFFVDLPKSATRKLIFSIHLGKRDRDPDRFDLNALAKASDGYSGAEIEQAIIAGLHHAYSKKSELTTEMVVEAVKNSPPLSVTMAERIAKLRSWAQNRCVPAE